MALLFLYFLVIWFWTLSAESSSQADIMNMSWFFNWLIFLFFFFFKSCKLVKQLHSPSTPKSLEAILLLVTGPFDCFPTNLLIRFLLLNPGPLFGETSSYDLGIQEKESVQVISISWLFSKFFRLLGTKNLSIVIWLGSCPQPFLFNASLRLKVLLGFLRLALSDSILAK